MGYVGYMYNVSDRNNICERYMAFVGNMAFVGHIYGLCG